MNHRWNRKIRNMGILGFALLLTACGAGYSQEETAVSYTAEYISLEMTDIGGYSHCLAVDGLWYVTETESGGFAICHSSAEGTLDREIGLESGEIPITLIFSEEKQELVCLIRTNGEMTEASCLLRIYDAEGEQQQEQNLEQLNTALIRQMLMTASGQIYAITEGELYSISADGSICSSCLAANMVTIAMDEAEDIYAVQSVNNGYEILRLNQQTGELESFSIVRTGYSPVLSHGRGLYFTNGNSLLQYADGWQNILSFSEQGVNGSQVQEILCTAENRYQVLCGDTTRSGEWELVCLKGQEEKTVEKTETVEKIPISIATVVKGRSVYTESIFTFNRSYPEYYLYQKEYADNMEEDDARQQQIKASLLGSDAPDLLEVYSMADYENYVDKGYLEPLSSYLEESDRVDLEDFLPAVVEEYTRNGQIYALPTTFTVKTLACSRSLLGERTSWTIEEFLDFLEEHPHTRISELNSNLTCEELTPGLVLGIVLDRGMEGFTDGETGEIKLDGERFRSILERIKDISAGSRETALEEEDSILWLVSIYQASVVRKLESENHEEMVLIGYPTAERGDGNALLSPGQPLAILSSSEEKEGAWLFIEGQLVSDYTYLGYQLPTRLSQLEKKLEYEWETYKQIPEGVTMSEDAAANYVITERQMDMVKDAIKNAVVRSDIWLQVRWIIQEEAEYYFSGAKSMDDVIEIIQNRVQLYLSERQ